MPVMLTTDEERDIWMRVRLQPDRAEPARRSFSFLEHRSRRTAPQGDRPPARRPPRLVEVAHIRDRGALRVSTFSKPPPILDALEPVRDNAASHARRVDVA
jgi:hypothetical protein